MPSSTGRGPSSELHRTAPPSLGSELPALALGAIDTAFRAAGLVRSPRGAVSRLGLARRPVPAAPEELTRPLTGLRTAANGVRLVAVSDWERYGWLWHGFATRQGGMSRAYRAEGAAGEPGDLNLGFTAEDERDTVLTNRRLLAEAVTGSADTPLVSLRQFHSNLVVHAQAADAKRARPCRADGHFTAEPGFLLAVQTADCIPVLVADRKLRVAAAFHAGWRGTVKRVVETGLGRMRLEFGSRPEDLMAAIGPGIGACCYAVGEDVVSQFESQFRYAGKLFREVDSADEVRRRYPMLFLTQRAPGHSPMGPFTHLDLAEANRQQLLAAGLKPGAIQCVGGCTNCHPELFFSHRAARGRTGRMMAVIGIAGK